MESITLPLVVGIIVFVVVFIGVMLAIRFYRKDKAKKFGKKVFSKHRRSVDIGAQGVRKNDFFEGVAKKEGRGRIYAFALLVAGIFGTLFMRLWSLQVINSESYIKLSENNIYSDVSIPAIRGRILDRNGKELVGNRPSLCVFAAAKAASNPVILNLLSLILGIPKGVVRKNILDDSPGAQADRLVAADVSMDAISFIREHQILFEGVSIVERTVRIYPYGPLAAHVLGYIGPVTDTDLLLPRKGVIYEGGDLVGKGGAEYAFENSLQGMRGIRTFKVDVAGNPLAEISESPPIRGNDVCLTIDADLQKETDRIIQEVIQSSHLRGYQYADAGAIVCIDVEDGGILASTSFPTYQPNEFTNGISEELWEQLNNKESAYPLLNRVIAGQYPAASTFKAFSAQAGLKFNMIGGDTSFYCNGTWEAYGEEYGQNCWIYPYGHGTLGLEEAINQSCDVYFYSVGDAFWSRWINEPKDERKDLLQEYLKSWGFGVESGVDIPGEMAGLMPDALWKARHYADRPEDAPWQGGDMTNMCIGQGFLLVTPLQIANGYAGIARNKMLVPHYFHSVLNDKGEAIVKAKATESPLQPEIEESQISRVKDGLERVIWRMGGSFNELPVWVAGKSGTAEMFSAKADYSWFVAYAPVEKPKYCVACIVEQAGDGSSAAVLGVQHTLAAIYGVDIGDIVVEHGSYER